MSKKSELHKAAKLLTPHDYLEFAEWREKPFAERYPHLTQLVLAVSVAFNAILLSIILSFIR